MQGIRLLVLLVGVMAVLTWQCPGNNAEKDHATPTSDQGTCSSSSCQDSSKTRTDDKPQMKSKQKENNKHSKSTKEDDTEIPQSPYRTSWNHNWDRQYPKSDANKPNATRTIIIIRHGQFQLVQADQNQSKPVLTNVGKVQSKLTGKRLKAMNIPISHVYYSATISAAETADQICSIISCKSKEATKALAEGAPPIKPVPPVHHWKPSKKAMLADGIRMEASFRRYFHRADAKQAHHSVDLIISHANAIRYLLCRSLQLPMEAWLRFNIANCGMTTLTIEPDGRVTLMGLNDIGHLPLELVTFT